MTRAAQRTARIADQEAARLLPRARRMRTYDLERVRDLHAGIAADIGGGDVIDPHTRSHSVL